MQRLRGLSRGGRLLLALAVGGAIFGIASAVQADIPDSGVIHGCYGKPGTPYKGQLRVRDFDQGEQCRFYENPLDWSQTGPTGVTGPTGATGPTGPTGPVGAFFADIGSTGTVVASSPGVTASHTATGKYTVTFPTAVASCGASATLGFNKNGGVRPAVGGETQADLSIGTPNTVNVQAFFADGTADDSDFHLLVIC